MIIGFVFCVIPGLIIYLVLVRRAYRFYNLVVTTTETEMGTQVTIAHPGFATSLVNRYVKALPPPPSRIAAFFRKFLIRKRDHEE